MSDELFEKIYKKYDGKFGDLVGAYVSLVDFVKQVHEHFDDMQNHTEAEQSLFEQCEQILEEYQ